MQQADHVLLTRFNLPSLGRELVIRSREGWLRDRVALFERYCLPSVARQSEPEVLWLIYFDPESPRWLRDKIQDYQSIPAFHPVFREEVSREVLISDIGERLLRTGERLITTNLDNDDALAYDFLARVRSIEVPEPRVAVYLARGLIKSPRGVFLRRDRHNAFCSVVERWDDPVTCWSDWHNLLPRTMPSIVVDGAPAWLQVVHGSNVSNRVRGRRIGPRPFSPLFGDLLDDVPEPSRRELMRDAVIDIPRQFGRESARAVVKKSALQLLGKERFDRVAGSLTARASRR